jgi:hypothetical protein
MQKHFLPVLATVNYVTFDSDILYLEDNYKISMYFETLNKLKINYFIII